MLEPVKDYAAPLAALDRVLRVDDDGIATAKAVTGNEPFFTGHYPEFPIFPGVFIVETVQQTVRRFADERWRPARLVEIASVRFLAPVLPGDVLTTECRCTVEGDELTARASCATERGKVADVKLLYRARPS